MPDPIPDVVALVTGGFDPIHPGHLAMFHDAKQRFGYVIAGLNSDAWLTRKKGAPFMSWEFRRGVVQSIRDVDKVIRFDDGDGTAINAIHVAREMFPDATIMFCNGGDRTYDNIPEMSCSLPGVEFVFGVGGNDKQASSSTLQEVVRRPWGFYHILAHGNGWLVKRIVVNTNATTSLQRHMHRGEMVFRLPSGPFWYTPPWTEHRLTAGEYIEIQTGPVIDEEDIIRTADEYGRGVVDQ